MKTQASRSVGCLSLPRTPSKITFFFLGDIQDTAFQGQKAAKTHLAVLLFKIF